MTRPLPVLVAAILSAVLGACTHSVHQSTVGGFEDLPRGANVHLIHAEAEQSVFLATGNTDFADRAMADLASRCPRGRIVGVEARHSTSLGFLSYTNKMRVSGYCLEDEGPSRSD